MAIFKSGDLVVLKSGGPTMTIDTVNTDIFDDNKITGVLCAWFVGEKLERVRFDHRAIEPVQLDKTAPGAVEEPSQEPDAPGDYRVVLDEMADALNQSVEVMLPPRAGRKKPKSMTASKNGVVPAPVAENQSPHFDEPVAQSSGLKRLAASQLR